MYIPEPYFKDIPIIGNLSVDFVFIENGYPVLFTCKNKDSLYLCLCRTVIDEQKWILSEIDLTILEQLINNTMSVYSAFKAKMGHACIAKWRKDNPKEEYLVIHSDLIEDTDLPDKDLFLDGEDEFSDYLQVVKNRILITKSRRKAPCFSYGDTRRKENF